MAEVERSALRLTDRVDGLRRTGRLFRFAVTILVSASIAHAQLHLVTGSSNQGWTLRFGSALFEVGEDGKVTKKQDLISSKDGFLWLGMSYELNQAVLVDARTPPRSVLFLNLSAGTVKKKCELPEFLRIPNQWLADGPGQGASLAIVHLGKDFLHDPQELYVLASDPSIPCEESLKQVATQQARYITPLGTAGVGSFMMDDSNASNLVFADPAGNLSITMGVGTNIALGYKLPSEFVAKGNQNVSIFAINSRVLVAALWNGPRFLVLKKSDDTWHQIPARLSPGGLRAFGKYVAIVEAPLKKTAAAQLKEHPGGLYTDELGFRQELGPGKSEWRTEYSTTGPSDLESFATSSRIFPGRLHVFDSDSDNVYTISTNQSDSEILLIHAGGVYYRVSNRLYRAPISDKGIGEAHLLATDDVTRDAHWAFFAH